MKKIKILLTCLLGISLAQLLYAQKEPVCDEPILPCSAMSVDIVAGTVNCPTLSQGCRKQSFDVYLKINTLGGGSIPTCLNYNDFDVTVSLAITGTQIGVPIRSVLNEQDTRTCSQGSGLANNLVVTGNDISLTLGPTTYTPAFPLASSVWLFTVVVDVWPTEMITLSHEGGSYSWTDRNGIMGTCSLPGDEAHVTIPTPTVDNRLSIRFAAPSISSSPVYQDMPFEITATQSLSIQYMQIDLEFQSGALGFTEPVFMDVPDGIAVTKGATTTLIDAITGYTYYRMPIVVSGNISAGVTTIFKMRAIPPNSFQRCGKMQPVIKRAMAIIDDQCVSPSVGQSVLANFGDCKPDCTENITIHAIGNGVPSNTPGNCQLRVDLLFDWTSSDTAYHLSEVTLKFKFRTNLAFYSIQNVYGAGASLGCPNNNTCYSFNASDKTLTVSFGDTTNNFTIRKGSSYITSVIFNANGGGAVEGVDLLDALFKFSSTSTSCVPFMKVTIANSSFPVYVPYLAGEIKTETPTGVEGVAVGFNNTPPCTTPSTLTLALGGYSACVCSYGSFEVTPTRTDNSLNGVTTLDLALITKHILGVQALGSPYKMIAADANKSGTITTFDVVELRKLILGIYDSLPNNKSWRFVPKVYNFPNPADPFAPSFPEKLTVPVVNNSNSVNDANFVAIKVGDVNNTATRPENILAPLHFNIPTRPIAPNQVFSIPLRLQGQATLEALQAAIRFDPTALDFVSPALGDVAGLTKDCFNTTQAETGLLRMVWVASDPEQEGLLPGQTLCYLTFRAKRRLSAGEMLLHFDEDDRLRPEGYAAAQAVHPLVLQAETPAEQRANHPAALPEGSVYAECRPNPVESSATLAVETERALDQARLLVLSPLGQRVYYREANLAKGTHHLPLEGAAQWPAGMYFWVLLNGAERVAEGNFCKN